MTFILLKMQIFHSKIGNFTTTNLTVTTVTVSMYLLTCWLLLQFLSISNINSHNSKNITYLFLIRSLQHCLYIRIISHVGMSVKQYKVFKYQRSNVNSSKNFVTNFIHMDVKHAPSITNSSGLSSAMSFVQIICLGVLER